MKTFRTLSKLTSWVIPSKVIRLSYRNFLASLDLKKDIEKTQNNYKRITEKLKNKDKIKVIFLVRENQKWTYQSLYEKFEKSDKFNPIVIVSVLTIATKGKDKTRNNLEENYNFFKSRGMNVDYGYKNEQFINLKTISPDIIFYDQPWNLPDIHQPEYVSEFALTYYCSYSYELIDSPEDYTTDFHRFLYKFFVEDELNIKRYAKYNKDNAKNCIAVGYPKLDEYFNSKNKCDIWKDENKIKVIYAPHHSIENNGLRLATFKQNGKFILNLAKKHSETTWLFKPHPRLKYAIIRTKTMTEDEINNYFDEWEQIGAVYKEGDYINIFKTSDLMITDGCSFLAEYLPTKKPLIRLINKQGVKLNELGEKITKGFYIAKTKSELENIFNDIVANKKDEKLNTRENLIKCILNPEKKSCENIYDMILKNLENN